jgi:hypothetical protein
MASGVNADWCGPLAIASLMSDWDHGAPVFVGHPKVAQSISVSAAGCDMLIWLGTLNFYDPGGTCRMR